MRQVSMEAFNGLNNLIKFITQLKGSAQAKIGLINYVIPEYVSNIESGMDVTESLIKSEDKIKELLIYWHDNDRYMREVLSDLNEKDIANGKC